MSFSFEFEAEDTADQLYATQGGGTARWDDFQRCYVFVDPPSWSEYRAGDPVPREWDMARIKD